MTLRYVASGLNRLRLSMNNILSAPSWPPSWAEMVHISKHTLGFISPDERFIVRDTLAWREIGAIRFGRVPNIEIRLGTHHRPEDSDDSDYFRRNYLGSFDGLGHPVG